MIGIVNMYWITKTIYFAFELVLFSFNHSSTFSYHPSTHTYIHFITNGECIFSKDRNWRREIENIFGMCVTDVHGRVITSQYTHSHIIWKYIFIWCSELSPFGAGRYSRVRTKNSWYLINVCTIGIFVLRAKVCFCRSPNALSHTIFTFSVFHLFRKWDDSNFSIRTETSLISVDFVVVCNGNTNGNNISSHHFSVSLDRISSWMIFRIICSGLWW